MGIREVIEDENLTRISYNQIWDGYKQIENKNRTENLFITMLIEKAVSIHYGAYATLSKTLELDSKKLELQKSIVVLSILPVMHNLDNAYRSILKGQNSTYIPLIRSVLELILSEIYALNGDKSEIELFMKYLTETTTKAEWSRIRNEFKYFSPKYIQEQLYKGTIKFKPIRKAYGLQSAVAHQIWKSSFTLYEHRPSTITESLASILELFAWSLTIILWFFKDTIPIKHQKQIGDLLLEINMVIPELDLYPKNNKYSDRMTMVKLIEKLTDMAN
jgi:hypothetical protein